MTLDGSASFDADNDTLTYAWAAPSGVALSDTNGIDPIFTAPTVSTATDYIFSLVVNDGTADSTNTATVTITVNPIPPTTSPNDLPFTAVNFGEDANRSAKWRHLQYGIEVEIHYRVEETITSNNQAIRKLVVILGGSAPVNLVDDPDWQVFDTAIVERSYRVGTDGSPMNIAPFDQFSVAAYVDRSWVIDVGQPVNGIGRLTLTNSFTWMRDPLGNILSFKNREDALMHLDRDDLGLANDKVELPGGDYEYVYRNKEVASLRGTHEGEYLVNIHVYNKKPWKDHSMQPSNIRVELIKLNPYKEVTQAEFVATRKGQEFTAFHFTLDDEGEVIGIRDEREC